MRKDIVEWGENNTKSDMYVDEKGRDDADRCACWAKWESEEDEEKEACETSREYEEKKKKERRKE